jgi:xanthine dehydrogenase accessory factor
MEEIINSIRDWLETGKSAALVTVISRQGSAPREVGAKMAVSADMQIVGSVSSGCVEGAAAEEAVKAMHSCEIVIVDYGISDDLAWSVGLTCGGQIRVLVQPVGGESDPGLNRKILDMITSHKLAGKTFSSVTSLGGKMRGEMCLVSDGKVLFPAEKHAEWITPLLLEMSRELEVKRQSGVFRIGEDEFFADVYAPPERLLMIGAVHVAIPLAQMAKLLGFLVIVIDPRAVFATKERFPMVDMLVKEWPTDGLKKVNFSREDYIVLLSHDDKLDLPALAVALDKKAKYIGMLSSRSSRDKRFEIMASDGYDPDILKTVHSPVGLDIGGKSAEEIALSIIAEITAVKNDKTAS